MSKKELEITATELRTYRNKLVALLRNCNRCLDEINSIKASRPQGRSLGVHTSRHYKALLKAVQEMEYKESSLSVNCSFEYNGTNFLINSEDFAVGGLAELVDLIKTTLPEDAYGYYKRGGEEVDGKKYTR
jgi:hypothetical protein